MHDETSSASSDNLIVTCCKAESKEQGRGISNGTNNNLSTGPDNKILLHPLSVNMMVFYFGIILSSIGAAFIFSQHVTHLQDLTFVQAYYAISFFMFVSFVLITVSYVKAEKLVEHHTHPELHSFSRIQYLIINLILFAFLNALADFLNIVSYFYCSSSDQERYYTASIIYHSCKMAFVISQIVFLRTFMRPCRVKAIFPFKLVLSVLLTSNVLLWLNAFANDTGVFDGKLHNAHDEYSVLNCTKSSAAPVHRIAARVSDKLSPFVVEYSLLSISLLFHTYSKKNVDYPSPKEIPSQARLENSPDETVVYRTGIGALLGIVISVFIIFPSYKLGESDSYKVYLLCSYWSHSCVFALSIVLCCYTCFQLRVHHTHSERTYKADDKLLVLTSLLSMVPFLVFLLVSCFETGRLDTPQTSDPTALPPKQVDLLNNNIVLVRFTTAVFSIVNIIQVYTQTFTILYARLYKRQIFDIKNSSTAKIRTCMFVVLFVNLALFLNDAFFELKSDVWQTFYVAYDFWGYKAWMYMTRFLYPIHIFYRFHATSMIAVFLFEFRKKSHRPQQDKKV